MPRYNEEEQVTLLRQFGKFFLSHGAAAVVSHLYDLVHLPGPSIGFPGKKKWISNLHIHTHTHTHTFLLPGSTTPHDAIKEEWRTWPQHAVCPIPAGLGELSTPLLGALQHIP